MVLRNNRGEECRRRTKVGREEEKGKKKKKKKQGAGDNLNGEEEVEDNEGDKEE